MSDLIKREDAIHILACEMYAEAQAEGYDTKLEDYIPEAKAWMNDALSAEAVQGVGRYENAMQKLREMPRYLNGVKAKQITKILPKTVQGEWIDIDNYYRMATCSHCHKVTMFEKWGRHTKPYDFCPNCGAKMKGADHETD